LGSGQRDDSKIGGDEENEYEQSIPGDKTTATGVAVGDRGVWEGVERECQVWDEARCGGFACEEAGESETSSTWERGSADAATEWAVGGEYDYACDDDDAQVGREYAHDECGESDVYCTSWAGEFAEHCYAAERSEFEFAAFDRQSRFYRPVRG